MGNFITTPQKALPWLDPLTSRQLEAIMNILAQRHVNLLALLVYGSVARHDERPGSDSEPSDVDVLAIFDVNANPLSLPLNLEVAHSIVLALDTIHLIPREIQVMLASRTLQEYDDLFLANVARDGILFYQNGSLPRPLLHLQKQHQKVSYHR